MKIFYIAAAVFVFSVPVFAQPLIVTAEPAPDLDTQFQQTNGWVGADGAFSTALSTNKTLWLFGDTFIGEVRDGKRVHVAMINSTIAIQQPGQPPQFFWKTNLNGQPDSFLKPADSRGFLWLGDAVRCGERLYVLVQQMRKVNDSAFGFAHIATWLATVKNPDDPPLKWRISQEKLPFAEVDHDELTFGSAVMKHDEYLYIYGNRSSKIRERQGLIVARAPEKEVAKFRAWEFYDGRKWTKHFREVATLPVEGISEGSMSWIPSLHKFVLVYGENIWGKIVLRTADAPAGPWSEPVFVYQAPDLEWGKRVFSYAGKAHPEISAPGELIVTYAANSMDFGEVVNNARLYWPRFIRVKLATP